MLLKNELKKLYIKQYGLIVLLIVFIVKLLTSADLYKASYSDMSYEQQKYYLEYMQEYGGQLTDEKETAILSLYSEAEAAKQLQSDILDKNRNGDYATPEEFTNAMREIPDIIEKYDAIKLLYSNYERVSADRENLLMLPSGSNAIPDTSVPFNINTLDSFIWLPPFFLLYISLERFYFALSINPEQHLPIQQQ